MLPWSQCLKAEILMILATITVDTGAYTVDANNYPLSNYDFKYFI